MTAWLRWIALQAALTQATMVSIRVLAGYRALEFDVGAAGIGMVASAFAIPALIASILVGRASDRVGGAVVATLGIVLNCAGIVMSIAASSLVWLVAACAVSGLGHVAALVGQQVFVTQHAKDVDSDSAFGVLTAWSSIGQLIAPPIVGLAITFPPHAMGGTDFGLLVALGFALLSAIGAIPSLRTDHAHRRDFELREAAEQSSPSWGTLWRAVLVSGIVLAAIDLLYSFLPLWAAERGISAIQVGILLAVRAAVGVVARFGLGRLVTRFGRKALICVSVSAAALAFVLLPFIGLVGAYIAMIGVGIGLALPQPLTVTWLVAGVDKRQRGRRLGLRMTANRAAQSLVPLSIGVAAAPLGAAGVFLSAGILLAGAAGIAVGAQFDSGPPPET